MLNTMLILAVEETAKEGGLFDINATLPLMAIQFLVLVAILNAVFYKPLTKAIEDRDNYVRSNLLEAKQKLTKAEALAQQYEQELSKTRKEAQMVIAQAQAEASKIATAKVAEAQAEAIAKREQAAQEIEAQKQAAYASLEAQVDSLSNQIIEKLIASV